MSKPLYKSDKAGKEEKILRAEKLEKQAWIEKMERQEKLRSVRAMDPLEAHVLSKITAGIGTVMTGKHKEYLAEKVRGRRRRVLGVREGDVGSGGCERGEGESGGCERGEGESGGFEKGSGGCERGVWGVVGV